MNRAKEVFLKQKEAKHLGHAYLIIGYGGLDFAYWMSAHLREASSIDEEIEALKNGQGVDFILLDGQNKSIKKDDFTDALGQFQTKALEASGNKILVVDQIESATIQAQNAILKQIEEPEGDKTYYFFTSQNPQKILPTILSRCLTIYLDRPQEEKARRQYIDQGFDASAVDYALGQPMDGPVDSFLNKDLTKKAIDLKNLFLDLVVQQTDFALGQWLLACDKNSELNQLFIDLVILELKVKIRQDGVTDIDRWAKLMLVMTLAKQKLSPSFSDGMLMNLIMADIREVFHGKSAK